LLEKHKALGGSYREEVFADCGHSPHIEKPDEFRKVLIEFLP
jgi:pimeloyl-ACP methyl ester carboxylesterase